MFKHKRSLILMIALGAALSAGGTALASEAPAPTVYPDDGKIRLQHTITEQLCEFDTMDAAREFVGNVEDSHNWVHVQNGVPEAAHVSLAQAPEPEALTGSGTNTASASGQASDIPTLTDVATTAETPAAEPAAAPAGTETPAAEPIAATTAAAA